MFMFKKDILGIHKILWLVRKGLFALVEKHSKIKNYAWNFGGESITKTSYFRIAQILPEFFAQKNFSSQSSGSGKNYQILARWAEICRLLTGNSPQMLYG